MARLFVCIFLCSAVAAVSCIRFHDGKDGINGMKGKKDEPGASGTNGVDGKDYNDIINWIGGKIGPKTEPCVSGKNVNGKDGKDGKNGIDGMEGKKGDIGVSGRNGVDGKDGIDGMEGKKGDIGVSGRNGVDGKDGKDGIDGIDGIRGKKGDLGVSGRNGVDGKDGMQGKKGDIGASGRNGVDGKDGMQGKKGDHGISGRDGVNGKNGINAAKKNWKECAWSDINDDKDLGLIKNCLFKKKSTTSYLKVRVTTDMRLRNCFQCCKRWYVTFNGKECSPVAIDGIVYIEVPKANVHRPRTIGGHCKIPQTGNVNVGLHIGNCRNYGNADGYTGWHSSTHFFVEEVVPPQA